MDINDQALMEPNKTSNDNLLKVVEEMKKEPELDMESVLEVFRDHDDRVRGFLETGTATEHDEDPVSRLR